MTAWLLDTNVVSRFAPGRNGVTATGVHLGDWMRAHTDDLFLSVVSITEIVAGIGKLRGTGATSRADALTSWLDGIASHYGDHIVPVDMAIAHLAGTLSERARAAGHSPGLADILIAATALCRGHGLLTTNIRHFAPLNLDVPVLDPLTDTLPT